MADDSLNYSARVDVKTSYLPLIFILVFLGFIQVITLITALLINVYLLTILECMWSVIVFLILRSLYFKRRELVEKKDADIFLAGIKGTDFDSEEWHALINCPSCKAFLITKKFSSARSGHIWEFRYCKKCDKTIGKRMIVRTAIEEEKELTNEDIDTIERLSHI